MRALLSHDIDPDDPDFARLLMQLLDCIPAGRLDAVTKCTGLISPITVKEYNRIFLAMQAVAETNADQIFFTFSLHDDDDPIFGVFRPPPGETDNVSGDIDDWGN